MLNLRVDDGERFDAGSGTGLSPTVMVFLGDVSQVQSPNSDEIKRACQAIRNRWCLQEEKLRKLRSRVAIETGVCRNH
ncbi:MAG: hypothetical protein ACR2NK_02130 [Mariniblastus sp.]